MSLSICAITEPFEGRYLKFLNKLARLDILILDDWAMKKISSGQQEDLHELLDDRMNTRSTIMASQIPIESWHGMMANPTLSDVTWDRLVHIAHRVKLKGQRRFHEKTTGKIVRTRASKFNQSSSGTKPITTYFYQQDTDPQSDFF